MISISLNAATTSDCVSSTYTGDSITITWKHGTIKINGCNEDSPPGHIEVISAGGIKQSYAIPSSRTNSVDNLLDLDVPTPKDDNIDGLIPKTAAVNITAKSTWAEECESERRNHGAGSSEPTPNVRGSTSRENEEATVTPKPSTSSVSNDGVKSSSIENESASEEKEQEHHEEPLTSLTWAMVSPSKIKKTSTLRDDDDDDDVKVTPLFPLHGYERYSLPKVFKRLTTLSFPKGLMIVRVYNRRLQSLFIKESGSKYDEDRKRWIPNKCAELTNILIDESQDIEFDKVYRMKYMATNRTIYNANYHDVFLVASKKDAARFIMKGLDHMQYCGGTCRLPIIVRIIDRVQMNSGEDWVSMSKEFVKSTYGQTDKIVMYESLHTLPCYVYPFLM